DATAEDVDLRFGEALRPGTLDHRHAALSRPLVVAAEVDEATDDHDERQHRRGGDAAEGAAIARVRLLLLAHCGASNITMSLGNSSMVSTRGSAESGSGSRNLQSSPDHSTTVWFTAIELSEYSV